jgi:hypothetical protein
MLINMREPSEPFGERALIDRTKQRASLREMGFLLAVLVFLCWGSIASAQNRAFNLVRLGVKGLGGMADTCYLNSMINEWIERTVDASGAKMEGEPVTLPFNIEYGFEPFVAIQPLQFLQLGVKIDFVYSRLTGKTNNPLTKQDYELAFRRRSYIPGLYANLVFGQLELGAGILYSYTSIDVDDSFFGYRGTWSGEKVGYELALGFFSSSKSQFGYTMSLKYRSLVVDEFRDDLNRRVSYAGTQRGLSLDMSGFVIEAGVYFQFVEMGK